MFEPPVLIFKNVQKHEKSSVFEPSVEMEASNFVMELRPDQRGEEEEEEEEERGRRDEKDTALHKAFPHRRGVDKKTLSKAERWREKADERKERDRGQTVKTETNAVAQFFPSLS